MNYNDYDEIVSYLSYKVPVFAVKSGHNNIKELLKRLGNPELKMKYIHVAGTNGKGSVCKMLSTILKNSHMTIGLFTSPHIVHINERMKINNRDISNSDFVNIYKQVEEKINDMLKENYNHPTFFEIMFAMALLYFLESGIDIAIIETGIGGRLDTTNIIEDTILCVITNIGFDHTAILGDTIEEIAKEKAGIIKHNSKVVLNSEDSTVNRIIEEKCREKSSKLYLATYYHYNILKRTFKGIDFSIKNKYYSYQRVTMNIVSNYQIENVSAVLTAVEALKDYQISIREEAVLNGLKEYVWPGRMEMINDWILLDGAHNELGIKSFVKHVNQFYFERDIILVLSILKSKDYQTIIKEIATIKSLRQVIITRANDKSVEYKVLKEELLKYSIKCRVEESVVDIMNVYETQQCLLCFVGSLYLVSSVKKVIGGSQND